ncbi:MAG: helix-turn-helix transcriptional regulator [Deltaproteobacteria bacterium]|nr:helix-turn-helix transcriptional regulator [Deltaproteobacteria bacterium]
MNLSEHCKRLRQALGLSQAELGRLCGLSLPSIQNIEAGRANPSLSSLEKLLDALGHRLQIDMQAMDWDLLASLGAPLSSSRSRAGHRRPSGLLRSLRLALLALSAPGDEPDRQRKQDCVQALLLALKLHFPSFYRRHFEASPLAREQLARAGARAVRLERIAVRALAEYL